MTDTVLSAAMTDDDVKALLDISAGLGNAGHADECNIVLQAAVAYRTSQRDMATLQARLAERDAEVERLREALDFYACEDTYGQDMEGDGTPIPDSVVVLRDNGYIAQLALGKEAE